MLRLCFILLSTLLLKGDSFSNANSSEGSRIHFLFFILGAEIATGVFGIKGCSFFLFAFSFFPQSGTSLYISSIQLDVSIHEKQVLGRRA
jgi:hypothetical protein